MEPMPYTTRQKFMSHKCALHGVEDYDIKGVENLSDSVPVSWEELIVNPLILDMNFSNQIHLNLDYTKGFTTFGVHRLQEKKVTDNLTDKFVGCITDYIISDKWSPYYEINEMLYVGVMGSHKVLLGDMPEVLLRQVVGNTLSIQEV